ncbi:hypothetical protein GMORB2_4425 [Geosmithia morbida]|uniref:PPM-type phosphatase domain-containing protein n=1 Tax=Geosmithia morbida TaxID=1094350 RepID=A0A9P4YRM3_9HYPO|nr:uncharacterized protein GMORB2_4425 [Geosmithia morbida]KAF4119759.1 hypothetical protein GMORB2_4425 [Geosmithia morbida]
MFGSGTTGNSSPGSKAAAAETTDDAAAAKIPLSSPTTGSDGVDEGASTTPASAAAATPSKTTDQAASGEKRSGNGSPTGRNSNNGSDNGGGGGAGVSSDKKRRSSSSVGGKASSLIASAKNSLNFAHVGRASAAAAAANANSSDSQSPIQKLGRHDPALAVPQGQYNNSAGESLPGPKSTFRVGVWEDRNKKCRRTMEDTHAFLYNFLSTTPPPRPATTAAAVSASDPDDTVGSQKQDVVESDNGYFAIFDGHAGTFAADWCGKKLHVLLEDTVRRNPTAPMPELLDQTFTAVDSQLEKLPVKNSGCTAAIAALRLSYDHKGSDENEGRRIANAGGLILNNRVNGVLAVTRALGDTYMKDLVTGHPYTTETVIQPGSDEFVIIACDGIWDVCSDQEAVDLVRDMHDPVAASKLLVDHALSRFSTDNLSCMVRTRSRSYSAGQGQG